MQRPLQIQKHSFSLAVYSRAILIAVAIFALATDDGCGAELSLAERGAVFASIPHNQQESKSKKNDAGSHGDAGSLESTVGFPKLIFQHVIRGPKVVAKPISDRAQPVIIRIVETYSHGSDFRYDIEYKALEPGSFNIADYLTREDGSEVEIPEIKVSVRPILAADEVLPYDLPKNKSGYRSYYLPTLLVFGIVWVAGLLMILFYGRGKYKQPSSIQKTLTVADRMRPLVDAAIAGELTSRQQAELERVLTGFWSKKLRLNHLSADEIRQRLREHDEASLLLNQIDAWLHRPKDDPENAVDVNELLEPYQTIDHDSI